MYTSSEELTQELEQLSGWKRDNEKGFTLGFLLRKLPERTEDIRDTVLLGRATSNKGWSIVYRDLVRIADTPESAACRLACELFKRNILKKEVK